MINDDTGMNGVRHGSDIGIIGVPFLMESGHGFFISRSRYFYAAMHGVELAINQRWNGVEGGSKVSEYEE